MKKYKLFLREKNITSSTFDIETTVLQFVKQTKLKLSSQKTYLNWILGAMGRDKRWRALDTQRVLHPGMQLRDFYRDVAEHAAPTQAIPATLEALSRMPEPWRSYAHAAFLLASRLADFTENVGSLKQETGRLTICYKKHKTVGIIGQKDVTVAIPPDLKIRLLQHPPHDLYRKLKLQLKQVGLAPHSLRRGGIAYHQKNGMTDASLMKLTLHVALKNYLRYVNTVDTGILN